MIQIVRIECLALSKLIAVAGLGASAFIGFGAVSTILSSTLLLTSIKVGLVVFMVIISHDIYATAKKKQTTLYAPAIGGSLEGFFDSAFENTWCKPLWINIAMVLTEVYLRIAMLRESLQPHD